jgi:hypothetical protein
MITQISITKIEEIANEIQKINYDCNELRGLISGEINYQKVNDTYNKIIIEKVSDTIKTVVIDCDSSKIKSIAFYGSLNIQAKELFYLFKIYREHYSIYDDLYFYFFNEKKSSGNYILSFFESSAKKNRIKESDEHLSNLMFSW